MSLDGVVAHYIALLILLVKLIRFIIIKNIFLHFLLTFVAHMTRFTFLFHYLNSKSLTFHFLFVILNPCFSLAEHYIILLPFYATNIRSTSIGLPQGSCPSPILFNVYMRPIINYPISNDHNCLCR